MQPTSDSSRPGNHLLSVLSEDDYGLIRFALKPVLLSVRQVVEAPNRPITHVYFPEASIISVVATIPRVPQCEIGLIGREGMSGLAVVLEDDHSPLASHVQLAGRGMRIAVDDLRQAMQNSTTLTSCFLRFAHAFMTQMAHTAIANAKAKIEVRLARWILMAHDRLDADRLPLTHEFLALVLAVRRASVTVSLNKLETRGLIRTERGQIVVLDRNGLREIAGGLYGLPEAEYRRLTGRQPSARPLG